MTSQQKAQVDHALAQYRAFLTPCEDKHILGMLKHFRAIYSYNKTDEELDIILRKWRKMCARYPVFILNAAYEKLTDDLEFFPKPAEFRKCADELFRPYASRLNQLEDLAKVEVVDPSATDRSSDIAKVLNKHSTGNREATG